MTTVDDMQEPVVAFNPAMFDGFTPVDACGAQYTIITAEGFPLLLFCEQEAGHARPGDESTPHLGTFGWVDPLPDTESIEESEHEH